MSTSYVADTATNLRNQWAGTSACADRAELIKAIRFATESDSHIPTSDEIEAVADVLADLIVVSREVAS